MARGLAIPFRVASWGGVATVESDDNDEKIISLALGSDDNENAFNQNIGLGEDIIFDLSDTNQRGRIIGKIRAIFKKFEIQKRYRLVNDSIRWEELPGTGELNLSFKYFNIESDELKDFTKTIRTGGQ